MAWLTAAALPADDRKIYRGIDRQTGRGYHRVYSHNPPELIFGPHGGMCEDFSILDLWEQEHSKHDAVILAG
jgi:hypothetical protein